MGLEQGPQLADRCPPGVDTNAARRSSPGWANGWLLPSLSRDGPPTVQFSWEGLEEGNGGSCKVLLGIPNHPPLALTFILKRASFPFGIYLFHLSNPVPASRIQDLGSNSRDARPPRRKRKRLLSTPEGVFQPSLTLEQSPRMPAAWLPACQGHRNQSFMSETQNAPRGLVCRAGSQLSLYSRICTEHLLCARPRPVMLTSATAN